MSIPAWIDTSNIEANFVIANTPQFLVRRVREDKASYLLSQGFSGDELLKEYIASVGREPQTLRELITPYLFLAALFLKSESKFLQHATTFSAMPQYKWLNAYAQILIDTYRPISMQSGQGRMLDSTVMLTSSAAINFQSSSAS